MGWCLTGVNSHTFQPTPRDLRYLADADVVILNGLYLEIPTEKLLRSNRRPELTILKLGDQTIAKADWVFDLSLPKAQNHPNPHLWLNVRYAMRYAELVRDQLRALDPAHAATYDANTSGMCTDCPNLTAASRQLSPAFRRGNASC